MQLGKMGEEGGSLGRRLVLAVMVGLVSCCGVVPAVASAFATVEGPARFSSAAGLPDGRVYEQVSPADKNGNAAGAPSSPSFTGARDHYGYSSPDGDAVLFEGTGPMGESPWGNSVWFVATRNVDGSGWRTRALMPQAVEDQTLIEAKSRLNYIAPSRDLSHALVEAGELGRQINERCSGPMWLTGSDPFVAGTWVERPSPELVSPVESCGSNGQSGAPVGGTPDFSTVYFTVPGTLLPQDAPRAAHAAINSEGVGEAWGLYEYTEGVPREAGVRPDGSLSPFGAVPAASGHGANPAGNEVAGDGSRVFFVSPDPASCVENGGHNDCVSEPPELYVHDTGQERAELVSGDALLGEPAGSAVAAPGGIVRMPNHSQQKGPGFGGISGSYVFASGDGSEAFFQSTEALTSVAAVDSPGAEPKTYRFDVATGALVFLPGVQGEILAVDSDGSAMAFLVPEVGGRPAQLDLWRAGTGGGTVTPVVVLPEANATVPEARISAGGSSVVFQTAERLSSSFNGGGYEQIYRYDAATNTLGCVSCDPAGVTPRGNAELSILLKDEDRALASHGQETSRVAVDERGISSDGDRVFFDSPDPLVARDVDTNSPEVIELEHEKFPQGSDVYEWENGVVYLISTGDSVRNSYLLDSSEDGDDVFLATAQGLVSGDTDGGYDIYDARVPQSGDVPPVAASPCGGSSCQGDAGTGPSVASPVSASFSGAGNLVPEVAPASVSSAPNAVKCKRGYVKKKNKCVKSKPKKRAKRASRVSTDRRASR